MPIIENFTSFSDASSGPNGAEFSRVAGGIHTPFAVQDALQLGNLIGAAVVANTLIPEPTSALLLAPGIALLSWKRRRVASTGEIVPFYWTGGTGLFWHAGAVPPIDGGN